MNVNKIQIKEKIKIKETKFTFINKSLEIVFNQFRFADYRRLKLSPAIFLIN